MKTIKTLIHYLYLSFKSFVLTAFLTRKEGQFLADLDPILTALGVCDEPENLDPPCVDSQAKPPTVSTIKARRAVFGRV